jgi:hypothetical protein
MYKIKKNDIIILLIFFCSIVTISCSLPVKISKSGVVVSRIKFYEPTFKKYISSESFAPDTKIWFKDSIVIVRAMKISISMNSDSIETRKVDVSYYTYVDLTKMLFYRYTNFSDTAKIIESYTESQSDSIFWNVNWKFYKRNDIAYTEPIEEMADTLINKKTYKRLRLTSKSINENDEFKVIITYFDCTKKGTMFQYDKHLSEQVGCPMVSFEGQPTVKNPNPISFEIEFVTDKLTEEELKVFSAWEKNVKKYPVKQ